MRLTTSDMMSGTRTKDYYTVSILWHWVLRGTKNGEDGSTNGKAMAMLELKRKTCMTAGDWGEVDRLCRVGIDVHESIAGDNIGGGDSALIGIAPRDQTGQRFGEVEPDELTFLKGRELQDSWMEEGR